MNLAPLFPSLQIILQDALCEKVDLSSTLFINNAIMIGGSACSSLDAMTVDQFNAVTSAQAAATFLGNCKGIGINPATYGGLAVLDIESPVWTAQWYQQGPAFFAALKLRIDAIRGVLPKAKLGLYAVIADPYCNLPNAGGYPGPNDLWVDTVYAKGYQVAAKAGVFASLDYLCPLCPALWGPSDSLSSIVVPSVVTSIQYTQGLGTGKAIAPVLRFTIYNTASKDNGTLVSASVLRQQIQAAQATGLVDSVLIWAGAESDVNVSTLASACGNQPLI